MATITKTAQINGKGFDATKWVVKTARINYDNDTIQINVKGFKNATEQTADNGGNEIIIVDSKASDGAQSDYDGTIGWCETELINDSDSKLNGGTVA